jgi:hypothetical protein
MLTEKQYAQLTEDFTHLLNVCNEDERRGAKDAINILMNALKGDDLWASELFREACGL